MCLVQLKDRKIYMNMMFMLGLNEAIDLLDMANKVCWNGHRLRREDCLVMRRALCIEVESQKKKGRLKRT